MKGAEPLPVTFSIPRPSGPPGPVDLAVGPEQLVLPLNTFGLIFTPDDHISYLKYQDGSMRAFWACGTTTGAGQTVAMVTTNLAEFTPLVSNGTVARSVFSPDTPGSEKFDSDYSGPGSVFLAANGRDLMMVYHAENHLFAGVHTGGFPFYCAIGLARSTDGGRSWSREGQIISGSQPHPTGPALRNAQGAGNPCLIAFDGYLYVFYADIVFNAGGDLIHVARAPISTDGRPGTWQKWYNGAFVEPGLGGRSSAVQRHVPPANVTTYTGHPSVSYNSYLKRFLLVFQSSVGIHYSTSTDLVNWTVEGLLFAKSNDAAETFFAYPSFLSPDEPSDQLTGQTGYIYYAKNAPGNTRHVMHRRAFNLGGRIAAQQAPLSISEHPVAQSLRVGGEARLKVVATGTPPLSYQWLKDGVPVSGAISPELRVQNAQGIDSGSYQVVVTDILGRTVTSSSAALTVATSRLVNLSIRTSAGSGEEALFTGFVIGGSGNKVILARGIGPTLATFGVSGAMSNPALFLFDGSGSPVLSPAGQQISNGGWGGLTVYSEAFARVGAFPLPLTSRDAAFVFGIPPGSYSTRITPLTGSAGVVLSEIYDADATPTGTRFINLSARARAGSGGDILIAGFSIAGSGPASLLIRAVGPTLRSFGVNGTLDDPRLSLFDSEAKLVAVNDDWGGGERLTTTFSRVGAFGLPANSKDAGLAVELPPGSYTVQVSGTGSASGYVLIEVYEVP